MVEFQHISKWDFIAKILNQISSRFSLNTETNEIVKEMFIE